jgi:hypothetical protein
VRRLGWFLVGAAGATGALVAAPGLYGRLRAALGVDDPWSELEPEDEQQWGVLREAPPIVREPEPAAETAPEPVAEAETVAEAAPVVAPEPEPEPEPEREPEPEPEAQVEPEPEPESAAAGEPDAYETSVWSQPARVAEAPADEAEEAAPADDEPDDDTAEIAPTPLTPAPPPEDTEASDLRSRIEASRARLHRKAQAGSGEDEPAEEPDEPDTSA